MNYEVLLIEDNPGDIGLVHEYLGETHQFGTFVVHDVQTAADAVATLQTRNFDAILLDLSLPDSRGLATLTLVSTHAGDAPVIVLTGSDDEMLGLKALRNGAHDYLVKGQVFGTMMARAVAYAIQRHRTDSALRDTEARHRALFETMVQGAIYYDSAGRILMANPAALDILGISSEDATGRAALDGSWRVVREDGTPFPPEEFPTAIALRTGKEKNATIMGIYNPRDSDYRWVIAHARPFRREGGTGSWQSFTTFTDITPLRRAEQALKTSEERFRALIEHSHDLIAVFDAAGRFTYCSPSAARILGMEPADLIGQEFAVVFEPHDMPEAAAKFEFLLSNSNSAITHNWSAPHRDGSYRRLQTHSRNLLDHPAINGIVANVQDITERYDAEQRLLALHDRLAAVVDTSPLAILVVDAEHRVQLWNQAAERIFGWREHEVLGRHYPLQAPDDSNEPTSTFLSAFNGNVVSGTEVRRLTRNGNVVDIQLWNAQLRDSDGRIIGLVGIMADVTEQKVLQESLRHAQKMDAIGRLAGGIAHDFNNILTALGGHAGLLLDQLEEESPLRDDLLEIDRGVERAARLTRQLLTFSRKQVVQPKVIELNSLLSETEKMLKRVVGEDITLAMQLANENITIKVDPGQLEQVIVNLVVNARDAMPDGGVVTVATQMLARGKRPPNIQAGVASRWATLEVTDTGTGISPEVKARIFEPFFTTKPQGKGTGLGLPTAYGIVQQAGGALDVESEHGAGSTFRIYLPVVDEPIKDELPSRKPQASAGAGVILLVEDEPAVRTLTQRVLQRQGYTVLAAQDGVEAAGLAQERSDINLLITDVVMPYVSGVQLAGLLRRSLPNMEVLYISGYAEEHISHHGVLDEGIHFLEKPFTPDQIAAKVRELIASH